MDQGCSLVERQAGVALGDDCAIVGPLACSDLRARVGYYLGYWQEFGLASIANAARCATSSTMLVAARRHASMLRSNRFAPRIRPSVMPPSLYRLLLVSISNIPSAVRDHLLQLAPRNAGRRSGDADHIRGVLCRTVESLISKIRERGKGGFKLHAPQRRSAALTGGVGSSRAPVRGVTHARVSP